jgi:hypothetical protein
MAITGKTRKLLWGRSGSRCAQCRCSLVQKATSIDVESVTGDECHIIAKEINGPRGSFERPENIDGYDNLILLCKPHHKMIDDQPNAYTPNYLKEIKSTHERWVDFRLGQARTRIERSFDGKRAEIIADLWPLLDEAVKSAELLNLSNFGRQHPDQSIIDQADQNYWNLNRIFSKKKLYFSETICEKMHKLLIAFHVMLVYYASTAKENNPKEIIRALWDEIWCIRENQRLLEEEFRRMLRTDNTSDIHEMFP